MSFKGPKPRPNAKTQDKKNPNAKRPLLQNKREKRMNVKAELQKELADIKRRIETETPPRGFNPLANDDEDDSEPAHVRLNSENAKDSSKKRSKDAANIASGKKEFAITSSFKRFEELPISRLSKSGLKDANFTHLTKIQRAAIPHALAGRDVIGGARTGSGKTLAFVIPVFERLFQANWDPKNDGLGAVILSPTRELAAQIFETIRSVGKNHPFSAGMVIGGKNAEIEAKMVGTMNILVATPGRFLHHMDKTYDFNTQNLRILVLDEADRILTMGFKDTIDSILTGLPKAPQRQTLLFSATQSKDVKNLARLSLHEPEYLGVHEADTNATPNNLAQSVITMDAGEKLDVLFSFIRTHLRHKTIVFLSTNKQVRYVYECFRRLRPGIPLMHLHGKMDQFRRMEVFYDFCNKKEVVLFATSVAARGLDFPKIDWVVQVDCPSNVEEYIHRVGRTARYRSSGNALSFILPSEKPFLEKLKTARVPVKTVRYDTKLLKSIQGQLAGFLAEDSDLKYLAQKAFVNYIRFVHLADDKEVFDVSEVDGPGLAESMGLPGVPVIRNLRGSMEHLKNMPYEMRQMLEDRKKAKEEEKRNATLGEKDAVRDRFASLKDKKNKSQVEKMLLKQNVGVLSKSYAMMRAEEESDEDEFISVKRTDHDLEFDDGASDEKIDMSEYIDIMPSSDSEDEDDNSTEKEKAKAEKKKAKKIARQLELQERLRNAMLTDGLEVETLKDALAHGLDSSFVKELQQMVKEEDAADKALMKERVREKHRKIKEYLRRYKKKQQSSDDVVQLEGMSGSDDSDNSDDDDEQDDDLSQSHKRSRSSSSEDDSEEEISPKRAKRSKQSSDDDEEPMLDICLDESSDEE